jgi:hypothetical protein
MLGIHEVVARRPSQSNHPKNSIALAGSESHNDGGIGNRLSAKPELLRQTDALELAGRAFWDFL